MAPMSPEEQMLIAASEWQEPVAVLMALVAFSFGFITVNSINA